MSGADPASEDRRNGVMTSVELPDGSAAAGLLVEDGDGLTLRLHADEELRPGAEVEGPDDRFFRVVDVRPGNVDDHPVTELAVRGPFLRRLEGHRLGDGWPQRYWREVAAHCDEEAYARPVVRFLRLLSELRTSRQIGFAREEMRSLSAEHLATVTGQVGGALLHLRRTEDVPEEVVGQVAGLYRALLDEMSRRCEAGEYAQPPSPASRIRLGGRLPEGWRECRDWADVAP